MSKGERASEVLPEPTEAEVMRSSAALYEFMVEGWLKSMNPEDLDLIAYAVLKFRGEPGDHTSIEDSAEHWEGIHQGTKELISEHLADQRALIDAQAQSATEIQNKA